MKQSLISILILLLSSSFVPIHARNKPQPAKSPSPVAALAPGPSNSDCSSIIYDMMDCLSYLTPGSNDTKPTKVCCGGILSVLQYNPKCICVGLESSKTMGFAVNNTRARAMPTTCKLTIVAPHCAILDEATPAASIAGMSPSQFMPLVGRDWTQSGVAKLFSAIKEKGYQLLFLSARAIVHAYLTRSFLNNLKQDGKALPNGPVVISPDGLFPALYREEHYNPFYAGFGNRDTDELITPSAGTPMTSPSSGGSPTSSPSLAESPVMTAPSPSSSGTNHLSVSTLTLVSVIVSSVTYISFLF
ncbi:hypothetical protein HID58_014310 [Brassica napus]|uniref:LNS2/PITP domain-containing protein n=1 Tax=Brassica napus TaxID=3708 RepID=A0ABQ8DIM2_BRANA|nr:hypothetical protein HID58_014310 [Brassica napus]